MESFDVVIVGAGSAGCVLANRLSQNPNVSVCLLEAGPEDKNPAIHIPFGLAAINHFSSINWQLETAPEKHLDNRPLYWPRGKTLGGSSSVNAMIYTRGHAKNYDQWAELGATGWDFNSVLPYFRKSENNSRGISRLHGSDGLQFVSDLKHINPLTREFVESAKRIGTPENPDFNGISQEGVGIYQVTHKNGSRCSTAKGFLTPEVKARKNLQIYTNALAKKLIIENKKAKGVEVEISGKLTQIIANTRVFVCSGAVHSPALLLASGIGAKEELEAINVPVEHELPGVGKNLQDHLDATIMYRQSRSTSYGLSVRGLLKNALAPFKYWHSKTGMFTSNIAEGGAFLKSSPSEEIPDIQIHFLPALLIDHGRSKLWGHGFTVHFCTLYPKSRGEVRLKRGADGNLVLDIHGNYLSNEDDLLPMVAGFKWARKVAQAKPLSHTSWEEIPGKDVETDEEIVEFIRSNAETIYHPVGTCKMGSVDDPMAVVDPELAVIGMDNLSVVDASIMPTLIGGNTNSPTIMIAERAADFFINKQHP
ncbi:GMC family oxidoreductase N-terminal domain-containing protein [Glaciecola sp. XM2]|uniref:GMC family oxidoreductase n=1 Tax=Glaciecola sp. XM2 TaxID=1914931 RepID=UPI001BDE4CB0|nr:GMC family oxidoreductase N-terminal domain-containing protein [Glaciecola sp. XM2]MBT1449873.1 GMC family oxidoreductase N-terminal domain-containing protein [Glaciecola sp. XM2]